MPKPGKKKEDNFCLECEAKGRIILQKLEGKRERKGNILGKRWHFKMNLWARSILEMINTNKETIGKNPIPLCV